MKHLDDNNMTYFQHLFFALKMAGALIIHAFLPWFFETYASDHLCNQNNSENLGAAMVLIITKTNEII
jgi:hypothetical protein